MTNERTLAPCRCGKVEFQIVGAPILRGICYCASCQEASRRHQASPGADSVLAEDGGTDYVLYRKDRVRCIQGGDLLEERRLKPDSPTRRMYARCCNTAMFLDFTKGHWLTVYRGRLPNDMANYPGLSGKIMLKLLRAWMAMGFRRPAVEGVP